MLLGLLGGALGSMISGGISSLFNSHAQDTAEQHSANLAHYNAELNRMQSLRSGSSMRQAYMDAGRSSTFEGAPINVPATSSPGVQPMQTNFDALNQFANLKLMETQAKKNEAESDTEVKKQEKLDSDISLNESQAAKNAAERDKALSEGEYLNKMVQRYDHLTNAQIEYLTDQSIWLQRQFEVSVRSLPYELKKLAAGAYKDYTEGDLNQGELEKVWHSIRNIDEQSAVFSATYRYLTAQEKQALSQVGLNEALLYKAMMEGNLDEIDGAIRRMEGLEFNAITNRISKMIGILKDVSSTYHNFSR